MNEYALKEPDTVKIKNLGKIDKIHLLRNIRNKFILEEISKDQPDSIAYLVLATDIILEELDL